MGAVCEDQTKHRLTIARDAEASAQIVVFLTIHLEPRVWTLAGNGATLGPSTTAALPWHKLQTSGVAPSRF